MPLARIKRLQKLLPDLKADALLVDDPTDLYYLTGMELSTGRLLVTKRSTRLLVDGRYIESCRSNSPVPAQLAGKGALHELLGKSKVARLAVDSQSTSYQAYKALQKELKPTTLVPCESPVSRLRIIKDSSELTLLRAAAKLGSQGYDFVLTQLKEEVTEEQVAQELEIFWKRRGGKKVAFDPIIAFGPNSSMPHYRAGKRKLRRGDAVLIDIGVTLNHYHSDMTRLVFFGAADLRLEKIYQVVLEAQQKALEACRPGVSAGEVDQKARQLIASHGYGDKFLHSLGHGVGLKIHEAPLINSNPLHKNLILEKGMVITIEPGIYLDQIGGVRLEDTVVITANGYENLTKRPTKQLILI
jgi:Xaa-Pro aminopeptidase